MSMDSHGGMILTEEMKKTCPNATLSTTNLSWTDTGPCGERPATNH
jgi:hypothetical protein